MKSSFYPTRLIFFHACVARRQAPCFISAFRREGFQFLSCYLWTCKLESQPQVDSLLCQHHHPESPVLTSVKFNAARFLAQLFIPDLFCFGPVD